SLGCNPAVLLLKQKNKKLHRKLLIYNNYKKVMTVILTLILYDDTIWSIATSIHQLIQSRKAYCTGSGFQQLFFLHTQRRI
ncbi:hypothetical protein, partial [Paenibacillus sp. P3E]|uniref:hypothetical protein n=1 Tax=Paenibacillus sp. P3E TaxID=1349435 RepID=UPI001C4A577E